MVALGCPGVVLLAAAHCSACCCWVCCSLADRCATSCSSGPQHGRLSGVTVLAYQNGLIGHGACCCRPQQANKQPDCSDISNCGGLVDFQRMDTAAIHQLALAIRKTCIFFFGNAKQPCMWLLQQWLIVPGVLTSDPLMLSRSCNCYNAAVRTARPVGWNCCCRSCWRSGRSYRRNAGSMQLEAWTTSALLPSSKAEASCSFWWPSEAV